MYTWEQYRGYVAEREKWHADAAASATDATMAGGIPVQQYYTDVFQRGETVDTDRNRYRTPFQLDRDRILWSDLFLRLSGKTQVLCGPRQLVENRLTHSLRVAQIARSVAYGLRLNTDLAEAIALGHDVGHTPFGHTGERSLNGWLAEKLRDDTRQQKPLPLPDNGGGLPIVTRTRPEHQTRLERHFTLGNDPNEDYSMHGRQSVRLLTEMYKEGSRPRYTAQTLFGIWRHSVAAKEFDQTFRFERREEDGGMILELSGEHLTLEAQVVRYADDIASIADLAEAMRVGLIEGAAVEAKLDAAHILMEYASMRGLIADLARGNCSPLITFFISTLVRDNEELVKTREARLGALALNHEAQDLLQRLRDLVKENLHEAAAVARADEVSDARITALCNFYESRPGALAEDFAEWHEAPSFPYRSMPPPADLEQDPVLRWSRISDWISLLTDEEVRQLSESVA